VSTVPPPKIFILSEPTPPDCWTGILINLNPPGTALDPQVVTFDPETVVMVKAFMTGYARGLGVM
jgi:hypothetical protein